MAPCLTLGTLQFQHHLPINPAFLYGSRWYFGETEYSDPPRNHNLKGTCRTLDRFNGRKIQASSVLDIFKAGVTANPSVDGDLDLGFGLCDSSGRTFFDDSKSFVIDIDGTPIPRAHEEIDVYFFGYGRDYFKTIHDFYLLSGPVPMLPRYALGNWWSRYWKYTEQSYKELLTSMQAEGIPFSVAVLDMDWHLVDVDEQFGRGWTGYTWNKEFFPNPDRFLSWLHANGYYTSLNLHPADGILPYEDQYPAAAERLGVSCTAGKPIPFDFTNRTFIDTYFDVLLHPEERRGVDFWWMDWQQGKHSSVEGLDPLWLLNHYHHYDLVKNGKRGLLLSRYAGLGSHRYPIGFSGDVHVTWESLQLQPYFTATSTNVGYTWWSHDIGGHVNGTKDHELFLRWVEFGVFSPINRLHSNRNPFVAKEPWRYPEPYRSYLRQMLVLRHKLIPYLYSMNYRCTTDLVPIITPLYYHYPMCSEVYNYQDTYFFGSELLIVPMIHPVDKGTGYTSEKMWLPEGNWFNFNSGLMYNGGKSGHHQIINRRVDEYGVLARAGAIIPLAVLPAQNNSIANPDNLEVLVFPGMSNHFELFEDLGDGFSYLDGQFAITHLELDWHNDGLCFSIKPTGDLSVLPAKRTYTLIFRGFRNTESIAANAGFQKKYDEATNSLSLVFEAMPSETEITVTIRGELISDTSTNALNRISSVLDTFQGDVKLKWDLYRLLQQSTSIAEMVSNINAVDIPVSWRNVLMETIGY